MTKLLIADDQKLFADMLKTILNSYPGIEVSAYAKNGEEALALYKEDKPDICLLDIQMSGFGGLEALKQIKLYDPDAKVVMLTTFGGGDNIYTAMINGADGYLLKDVEPQTLIAAIQCVGAGLSVMNSEVRAELSGRLKYFMGESSPTGATADSAGFDSRDLQIIRLIAEGLSNRTIAEKLNYSEGTIRNRVSMILAETGLIDRTQLALFAIKNRIV